MGHPCASALRFLASVATLALTATGLSCTSADCDENACEELLVLKRYKLDPETHTLTWHGEGIRIVSSNGDVNVTAGTSDELQVTFSAFSLSLDEDEAVREMKENLHGVFSLGNTISVLGDTRFLSDHRTGIDIDVTLPIGFNSGVWIEQDHGPVTVDFGPTPAAVRVVVDKAGDVSVRGAAGFIDIGTHLGNIDLTVATWTQTNTNMVWTQYGDIAATVPAEGGDGQIYLDYRRGQLTVSGVPASWKATDEGYQMGRFTGPELILWAENGDIALTVE